VSARAPAAYTCPVCGRSSWHPEDGRQKWCNACQGVTGEEPPEGFRWVLFWGGTLDNCGRLLETRWLEVGGHYSVIGHDETYVYDGAEYRVVE